MDPGDQSPEHGQPIPMNQALWDEFDPQNKDIMRRYQADLRETMKAMQKLALRRTVVSALFRPIHLCCPKHSYRNLLDDHAEINMTVMERNREFEYIEVKMMDALQPEL